MKHFRIQIIKQKTGERYASNSHDFFEFCAKKEAFAAAREELIRIANCDQNRGLSDSSEADVAAEIEAIKNGANSYYFDRMTYSFKIFSKKTKQ